MYYYKLLSIMFGIKLMPIVLTGLFGFIISELFFSSIFFGNKNLYLQKKTKKDQKNPTLLWIYQILSSFLTAFLIQVFLISLHVNSFVGGSVIGFVLAMGLIVPILLHDFIRFDIPLSLAPLNLLYRGLQFTLMGALLGIL